jgi:hypoxanthine phosphoribosyltransferase
MKIHQYISATEIQGKVARIASSLEQQFEHTTEQIVLVVVLNGSLVFAGDLMRKMRKLRGRILVETIKAKSYMGTQSHTLKIDNDNIDVDGKHVIIVEDISDSGKTLTALFHLFSDGNSKSVTTVALLDKPGKRVIPFTPTLTGFTIEDQFVIGYGMDYNGLYRELDEICILEP